LRAEAITLKGDSNPRALAPNQQFIVDMVEIQVGSDSDQIYVDVAINYLTVLGGAGDILLRFRYSRGGWKSRETRYECALSSGLRLPGEAVPSGNIP
jgi:hypothetical protein